SGTRPHSSYTLSAVCNLFGSRFGQNLCGRRNLGTFQASRRGIPLADCRCAQSASRPKRQRHPGWIGRLDGTLEGAVPQQEFQMTEVAAIPLWQVAKPSDAALAAIPATDYELTTRSATGDASAFEELYSRHSRRVYSLCLRMTANTAEAEDLAQEVFIQLHRKVGSFRGESAFTTWLHRLTVN